MTEGVPTPVSNDADDLARLAEIVRANSFGRKEVMPASGRPSSFYFDMKPSVLSPEGAFLITKLLFERCRAAGAAFVGGFEMGAVPITGGIVCYSHQRGAPIAGFFVRKAAKEHGARKRVEGLGPTESIAGRRDGEFPGGRRRADPAAESLALPGLKPSHHGCSAKSLAKRHPSASFPMTTIPGFFGSRHAHRPVRAVLC